MKYILLMSIIAQSLFSMDFNEKPVPCTTIANLVNVVPGVIAPLGVGCVGKKGVVILEKNVFTLWDTEKECAIIKKVDEKNKEKKFYGCDFAINYTGTKVAFSGFGKIAVYDADTGKQRWCLSFENKSLFLPIAFDEKDKIISYYKNFNESVSSMLCEDGLYDNDTYRVYHDRVFWQISPESNDLFACHPSKEEIIFNVTNRGYTVGSYKTYKVSRYNVNLFPISFPNYCSAIGQLYDSNGSGAVIIGRSNIETHLAFLDIDMAQDLCARQRIKIIVPDVSLVGMVFHPNNKLFFLLNKNSSIYCFDYEKMECIHTILCLNQEIIPLLYRLEKRLCVSKSGKALFAALKDKVVKVKLPFKLFLSADDQKQLFLIWSRLQLCQDAMLPIDVIQIIMQDAFKLYQKDAIKNTK